MTLIYNPVLTSRSLMTFKSKLITPDNNLFFKKEKDLATQTLIKTQLKIGYHLPKLGLVTNKIPAVP